MQLIAPLFIVNLLLIMALAFIMSSPYSTAGCYILGSEINGDGSTEYLMIGNCL